MRWLALLALLVAAGCRDDLANQPKLSDYEATTLWEDGAAARPLVEGTVARGQPSPADVMIRPDVTPALLERGRERYGIFCGPCHGLTGQADGRVVERGFPPPPSFLSARLRNAPAEHFVRVIGEGYGVMYPYGDRVAPPDRWAITAYIRALQRADPEVAPSIQARDRVMQVDRDG